MPKSWFSICRTRRVIEPFQRVDEFWESRTQEWSGRSPDRASGHLGLGFLPRQWRNSFPLEQGERAIQTGAARGQLETLAHVEHGDSGRRA